MLQLFSENVVFHQSKLFMFSNVRTMYCTFVSKVSLYPVTLKSVTHVLIGTISRLASSLVVNLLIPSEKYLDFSSAQSVHVTGGSSNLALYLPRLF